MNTYRKGNPMTNITIGRYDSQSMTEAGIEKPLTSVWSGWIEGTRDDGSSWIAYLDADGGLALYWPQREESGAVIGDPVDLSAA